VKKIKNELENFEQQVIKRTKENITPEEQKNGKLIQRLPADARYLLMICLTNSSK
jgi:hypothetical protein